jgi:hypothetical protein
LDVVKILTAARRVTDEIPEHDHADGTPRSHAAM